MSDISKNQIIEFLSAYCSKEYPQIDSVSFEVEMNKRIVILDAGNKNGILIGKKGKNIEQLRQVFVTKFGKGWDAQVKESKAVSGSSQRGRGVDNKRSVIGKLNLPLTVPYSSLKEPKMVSMFQKYLTETGPILVTLFRDTLEISESELLKTIKGDMNKKMLNFTFKVMEKFQGKKVKRFDWPDRIRSADDIYRSQHPYVSYCCRAAVIVYNDEQDIQDEEPFKQSLFLAVHDWTLLKSEKKWVILGDETGSLDDFDGKSSNKSKSTMCWVVVPPKCKLPQLPVDFHCAGNLENYKLGRSNLIAHKDILYFTFTYEQGDRLENSNTMGNDPHMLFWQDTLPLVLEHVVHLVKPKEKIDLFVEQVGPLEAGSGLIVPIVSNILTTLRSRKSWKKISFDEQWVISKGEHPWIGYPDALGANVRRMNPKKTSELIDFDLFSRVKSSVYRQNSLSQSIKQVFTNSSIPLTFLKSIYDLEAVDIKDYIVEFFSNAIIESIEQLDSDQWEDLLEYIDLNSKGKKGQRVNTLIHNHVSIGFVLEKLDHPSVKFDFLRMMLGTANHRGAISEGLHCAKLCEDILNSGFIPTANKFKKFQNLLPGLRDNMFDFKLHDVDIPEFSKTMTEVEIHNLGTIAQSLGLTGTQKNLDLAILIEVNLSNYGHDRRHIARHLILLAELLIDKKEYSKAKDILDGIQYNSQNSYLFAAQLKCYSLGEFELLKHENYVEDFIKLLDEDHPSQRIAYWYARWALVNDKQAAEYTQQCIKHLLSLTDVPLFSHDAPGVILACELIDLQVRGYELDFDTSQFYEMVKSNSQPSTLEWLEQNTPNEDDWLAPLNFNYC
jgi:hypothetical protein